MSKTQKRPAGAAKAPPRKFTVNFSAEFYEEFKRYADERGLSMTELVRHALTYERFLYDHKDWEFHLVQQNEDGERVDREIVLPMMTT